MVSSELAQEIGALVVVNCAEVYTLLPEVPQFDFTLQSYRVDAVSPVRFNEVPVALAAATVHVVAVLILYSTV